MHFKNNLGANWHLEEMGPAVISAHGETTRGVKTQMLKISFKN